MKTWSVTQSSIALSSAEAEFYAAVEATQRGIGLQTIMAELGIECSVEVWMDASAAKSFASRRGLGNMRHVETKYLWLQDAVKGKKISLRKVAGSANPADILTKYHNLEELERRGASMAITMYTTVGDKVEDENEANAVVSRNSWTNSVRGGLWRISNSIGPMRYRPT